jgi:hypothetical protein
MAKEDEVKVLAYNIWEQQGCPSGRDCEHWFLAENIWEQKKQKTSANNTSAKTKRG